MAFELSHGKRLWLGGQGVSGEREKQALLNLCWPGTRMSPSRAWAMNLRVKLNKEWGEPGRGASLDLCRAGRSSPTKSRSVGNRSKGSELAEQEERGDLEKKEVPVY